MSGTPPTIPEDCQAYDINSADILTCAKRIDPAIYGDYTDLPTAIERDVFPTGLKTLLTDCDGNSECKLVAYDFQADTGQKASSAEYITTVANTDLLDRGVFIKDGSTRPVITIEPPGYTYTSIPINPSESHVVTISAAPTANDQKSGEMCARFCDTLPTCVAFNYNSLTSSCRFFSSFDASNSFSYGEASFNDTSYIKDPVTSAVGKKQPSLMYAKTWLEKTGNSCTAMDLCNSNLTALVNTGTTVGFSTDDLLACSYCPTKTFQFKNNAYFVQDELGETRTFQDKSTAISELLFTDVPNPNNTIKTVDGVTRGTRDFMQYTVKPYNTQLGFSEKLLFVSSGTVDEEYGIYKILLVEPEYTCHPEIDASETRTHTVDGVTSMYSERYYQDSIATSTTTNPGVFTSRNCPVTQDSRYNWNYHRLCGDRCYTTANSKLVVAGCTYSCPGDYRADGFSPSAPQDCSSGYAKVCSKPAERVPTTSPAVFVALTARLLPAPLGSSNTFFAEDVSYVTDGFMFRNVQTQKYVTGNRTLLDTWADKYTPEYNSGIFVLSDPINILDYLKASFPNSNFLLQSPDGIKYTYDRTTIKKLENIFSLFPLTFNSQCTPALVSDSVAAFSAITICNASGVEKPSADQSTYDYSIPPACPSDANWIVIDIPNGFEPPNAVPDTTNVANLPSYFASAYSVIGTRDTDMFPATSYIDYSVTADNKNLREWVQGKIYYPYVHASMSFLISIIKDNAYIGSYYYQTLDCFNTKFTQINTDMQTNSMIIGTSELNSISQQLYDVERAFVAALGHRNTFLRIISPWGELNAIETEYRNSLASMTNLVKSFLGFTANQAIDNFKNIMTQILIDTGKYMVEAYGINDDDLRAISNSGSGGTVENAGQTGLIKLYEEIRNLKNDVETLCVNKSIEYVNDFLAGTASQISGDFFETFNQQTIIRSGYDAQVISIVNQCYQKYTEAYQRLQSLKRSAGPNDVPRIEDSLVQAALNSVQSKLNETMLELKVRQLDTITPVQLQAQIQSATKNAAETALHALLLRCSDGYYSATGSDPCTPCPPCTTTIANAIAVSTCGPTTGLGQCTVSCISSNFTPVTNSTGAITACNPIACVAGTSYNNPTGNEPCSPCKLASTCTALEFGTVSIDGCTATTGPGTCLYACNQGYTLGTTAAGARVCNPNACSAGTYSLTGNTPCATCPTCTITNGSGTRSGCGGSSIGQCSYTCNTDHYYESTSSTCIKCVTNSTSVAGSTACTCTGTLTGGTFGWSSVANSCTPQCNKGYKLSGTTCTLDDCVTAGGTVYAATPGTLNYDDRTFGSVSRTDTVTAINSAPCTSASPPSSVSLALPGLTMSVPATTTAMSATINSTVTYTTAQGAYCPVGTTYTTPPAGGQERCVSCPTGTYSGTAGKKGTTAAQCTDCTIGTNFSDTVGASSCGSCRTCTPSEYETTSCTRTTNRVCTACSGYTCPVIANTNAGTRSGCGNGSPGTCSYACSSGNYMSAGTAANPTCSPCTTTCPYYGQVVAACAGTETIGPECACPSNSVLNNWTIGPWYARIYTARCLCDIDYYSINGNYAPCGRCTSLSTCSPATLSHGTVSITGCSRTGTSAGVCSYACDEGYTLTGVGASRVCSSPIACSTGTTYSSTGNAPCEQCKTTADCVTTLYRGVASGCTVMTDASCSCPEGSSSVANAATTVVNGMAKRIPGCVCSTGSTYSANGFAPCTSCSTCGSGNYISTACTYNTPTGCSPCTKTCPYAGQVVSACVGTETTNPSCACAPNSSLVVAGISVAFKAIYKCMCDPGYYSIAGNHAPCEQCKTCTNMQYETAACTNKQNRGCTNYVVPIISGPATFNLNTSSGNFQADFNVTCTNTKVTSWSFTSTHLARAQGTTMYTGVLGKAAADQSNYTVYLSSQDQILDNGTQGGTVTITITATNPAGSATFTSQGYAYPYIISNWVNTMGPDTPFGMYLPYKATGSQKYGFIEGATNYYNEYNAYYSVQTVQRYELKYLYDKKYIVLATDSTKCLNGIKYGRPQFKSDGYYGNGGMYQIWTYVYPGPNRADTGYWWVAAYGTSWLLNGGLSGGGRFQMYPGGPGDGNTQIRNIGAIPTGITVPGITLGGSIGIGI